MILFDYINIAIALAIIGIVIYHRHSTKNNLFVLPFVFALFIMTLIGSFSIENGEAGLEFVIFLELLLIIGPSLYLIPLKYFSVVSKKQVLQAYSFAIFFLLLNILFILLKQLHLFDTFFYRLLIFITLGSVFYWGGKALLFLKTISEESENKRLLFYSKVLVIVYLSYFGVLILVNFSENTETQSYYIDQIFQLIDFAVLLVTGYILFKLGGIGLAEQKAAIQNEQMEIDAENKRKAILFNKIDALIKKEKLYLDDSFSLQQLTKRINTNTKYASLAINTIYGNNFNHYINHFRILAFKKASAEKENQHKTIESLALDCGFRSKSSFNRIFKNHTGETPSEYLKKMES